MNSQQTSPPQITALGKRACPDCGGEMTWDAAKQVLRCPFCGFVPKEQPAAGAAAGGAIIEHELERALSDASSERRGYGVETVKVKCQSCHAISVFQPDRVAQRCEFCGSPSIIPYQETRDPITPESLLPVRLSEPQVRDVLKNWYATRWFAPNRLKGAALTDTLKGIYVPYWTFDAQADARWAAESGDYYWDTEYSTDAQGNRVSRRVQKTRWYPSSGQHQHFFDDDLVPGTVGVRIDLLRAVEPFPTDQLTPYDPAFVRGWTVERYQVDLRNASDTSRGQMDQAMYAMCDRQVPGDTHRNLNVHTDYSARTFKHILVPVWVITYTFGPRVFQVIVNGFTGTVAGDRPTSWIKIFFYIILPLLIALSIFLLSQR
jgi:ribosomal protein S27E